MKMILLTFLAIIIGIKGTPVNITIGLLQNSSESNLAIERAAEQMRNQSNVNFRLRILNIQDLTKDSFTISSNEALTETSVVIATEVPAKITTVMVKLLRIPLITTNFPFCLKSAEIRDASTCQDEFSMIPNKLYLSKNIVKMLQTFSYTQLAVIFQSKRTEDLRDFMISIDTTFTIKPVPIETSSNGSITDHSINRLKSLTTSQMDAIILIYDEADVPALFHLFHSDAVDLCSVKMHIFLMDLLSKETMNICNLHTVIGMQVQKIASSTEIKDIFGDKVNPPDVLLYDALKLVFNVTEKLVLSKLWLPSDTMKNKSRFENRAANTGNFTMELKKVQLHGFSGNIQFASDGTRTNMPLGIVNVHENKLVKVGQISANKDISFTQSPRANVKYSLKDIRINGHLRVVTVVEEPFTFAPKNSTGSPVFTGFCIDLLDGLSKLLNFTYTVYEVADKEYGRNNGGKWTGMIGDVLYKKADIAAASLTITSTREEVIQFTKPYMELQNSYVRLRSNRMQFDPLQFLKPFTGNVWMLTVAVGIFCSIALYYIDYFSPYGWRQTIKKLTGKDGATFNAANSGWFCTASWLLQGGDNTPKSFSGRLFSGIMWFVILIVTSTYTANMAAYFTFKKSVTEQEDIESLLKSGCTFALKQHTALDQFLKNSDYRVYQLMAQKIAEQKKYVANASEGIAVARTDQNLLFLGEGPYSEWLMNKGNCDLKIVNGILPSRSYGFPVRKGSPIAEKISIGISHLVESNFIQKTKDHYWKELSRCKNSDIFSAGITEEGRIEPLQLVGFYGVLAVGMAASFVSLFAEKWWKKNSAEKKRKFTTAIRRTVVAHRPLERNSPWTAQDMTLNRIFDNQTFDGPSEKI